MLINKEELNVSFSSSYYDKYFSIDLPLELKQVKISFLIMTYNEERCIKRCLSSIDKYADEIIIIDTGSNDDTLKLIESIDCEKIKVYIQSWNNDFSYIRNSLVDYARNNWVFFIDADETLEENQLDTLNKLINFIDYIDVNPKVISPKIINHDGSEISPTQRIFKKNSSLIFHGRVHEELRYNGSAIFPFLFSNIIINHDGYKESILTSKKKYSRNFELLEKMLKEEPDNLRWYYFWGREQVNNIINEENFKSTLYNGLEKSKIKFPKFTSSIYAMLMSVSLDDQKVLKSLFEKGQKEDENNLDLYFYYSIGLFINNTTKLNQEFINIYSKIISLQYTHSLLNEQGDHIFYVLGKFQLFIGNYEETLKFWNKVEDEYYRNLIKHEIDSMRILFYNSLL